MPAVRQRLFHQNSWVESGFAKVSGFTVVFTQLRVGEQVRDRE